MSNIFTPRTGGSAGKGGPSLPSALAGLAKAPLIIAAVVGLLIVWSGFTTIDQGNIGVRLRFGEAVGTMQPGFHIVIPFMDRVVTFSTRTKKQSYSQVNAYSRDIQAADNLVSVNYRVDGSKAIEVYSRYGENFVDSIISPVIQKRFKEIFGKYDAREIVNSRDKLGIEVENNIRQNMPNGIIIEGVQIENIEFSDAYEQAIEATAQAEASVRKAMQELAQKKVDAEKVVVQAQADAQARLAAAKAEADAIKLKGEAEASAIQAKANALRENPGLVALTATEKWDGKLPTTFVPGSAVPFVQVPRGQ
jgi:regulator of protease activity HflC (stomatin/prohibitin superfamily)